MNYVAHQFWPNHTIVAVLRLYNNEDIDKATIDHLVEQFKTLNPDTVVMAGATAKIPLLPGITVEGMESA